MEAKELKQMRVNARMTIEQAARYALVSPRTWARWESGKVKIPERGVRLFEFMMTHVEQTKVVPQHHSLQAGGSNHGET
jgi:DNA-binding transcriptional regulator YiaG